MPAPAQNDNPALQKPCPEPEKKGVALNFNHDFIRIAIEMLAAVEPRLDVMLRSRDLNSLMETASGLNQAGVILQSFARKLKYAAKPYLVPPHWYTAGNDDDFLKLHNRINKIILKHNQEYKQYNYNYGPVLYQSLEMLNIIGHRETELRYDLYGLGEIIRPDDVILDIGANCGFMLIYAIYRKGCSGDCIDWNPYMLDVGKEVAAYLKLEKKIRFFTEEFQTFRPDRKYSAAFSFASHQTTDEGLRMSFREHMRRCADVLTDRGTLVFECQGWEYQKADYPEKIEQAREFFDIRETRPIHEMGREVIIMTKKG